MMFIPHSLGQAWAFIMGAFMLCGAAFIGAANMVDWFAARLQEGNRK